MLQGSNWIIKRSFWWHIVILVGKPSQLPPAADKPLYHKNPAKRISEQGYLAHWMFNKVIKLSVNQRLQGSDIRQVTFKLTRSK